MAEYSLLKRYFEFRGLDLRASDLERSMIHSPDTINADFVSEGGIKKREGIKISGKNYGIYGGARFQSITYFGEEKDELILFGAVDGAGVEDGKMYRMTRQKMAVTNSLASTNDATMTFKYNDQTSFFEFSIIESDGTVLLNKTNIDPTTDTYTISDLKTDIDAITGISTNTLTLGDNTTYAYMIDVVETTIFNGQSKDINYYIVEELEGTFIGSSAFNADPLDRYIGQNRLASNVLLNGILYVAGLDQYPPMKYDGFSTYGAGCRVGSGILRLGSAITNNPSITSPKTSSKGLETFSNSNVTNNTSVRYWAVLNQVDGTGNVTSSELQELNTGFISANQNARYTNTGTSYYNTFQKTSLAVINGSQNNVLTINVNSGHSLNVGDIACVWNNNSPFEMLVFREITATTATTITISYSATAFGVSKSDRYGNINEIDNGGSIDVLDDGFITAGTYIEIYRSKLGDVTPYFCLDFPMASYGGSVNYGFIDDVSDAQLGAAYLTPSTSQEPPPSCDIVSSYNNNLILGSLETQKEAVAYSNALQREAFAPTNQFILEKKVTGIGQSGEIFMAATSESVYSVSGDLNSFAFRVDKIAANIGCVSPFSVQQVDEGTLFFLSEKGPYMFSSGRGLQPVGGAQQEIVPRIEPVFTDFYNNDRYVPVFSKASSGVWKTEKKYYLYIPYALNDGNNQVDTREDSGQLGRLFVYDYARDAWFEWSGIQATGGIIEYKDNPYFINIYTNTSDELESRIQKQQRAKTIYSYCDHDQPINFNYDFQWETMGEASIFKKFLRLQLFGTNNRINPNQLVGIRTYKDYDDTNLRTDSQLQWSGEPNRKIKLKSDKMRACKIRIYDDATLAGYNNPIEITGYEVEAAASYKGRIKQ